MRKRNRIKRTIKRLIPAILVLLVVQFVVVELLLIGNAVPDQEKETEYLIILGAGLNGETPSLSLYERLKTGLDYLLKYPDTKVVVSGGQGRGESITEAEAMRRYLIANGISHDRILSESMATSTMENFKYSKKLIEEVTGKPVGEISFVTSSFHILRSKMLAKRNGLKAYAISSKTPDQVIIQMYFREYFAFFKSLIIDR